MCYSVPCKVRTTRQRPAKNYSKVYYNIVLLTLNIQSKLIIYLLASRAYLIKGVKRGGK